MKRYTQEQIGKAICLYKTGLSITKICRTLGYPDKATLHRWIVKYRTYGKAEPRKIYWKKYSDVEIESAIKKYFENGENAFKTSKELGYPSHNTLSRWVENKYGIKPKKHKKHMRYSTKEKSKILIEAFVNPNGSIEEVCKKYNICKVTLYNWRKTVEYKEDKYVMKYKNIEDCLSEIDKKNSEIERLNKIIEYKKMEIDILETADKIIKKEKGISPKMLNNQEKAALIDALKDKYKTADLIKYCGIAKSSYYYQVKNSSKPNKYLALRKIVSQIFYDLKSTRGYRCIYRIICRKFPEHKASEKVIRRIMKEEGLVVLYNKKRKKWSSYEGEISKAPENLLFDGDKHDFKAGKPNTKWLTDITQFDLPEFKCYLSPIVDCYDGYVVSWELALSPNANLANTMLKEAINTLKPNETPIIHSDRGGHYRWNEWIDICNTKNLVRSLSRKGRSPDNAACEGFFGRLKNEFYYYRDWEGVTYEQFYVMLSEYIYYYNNIRLKESLGWKSPKEYREEIVGKVV